MTIVTESEAQAKFRELMDRSAQGEEFIITRDGAPVARLACVRMPSREETRKAIDAIKEASKGVTLGGISIRKLIEEGRRY